MTRLLPTEKSLAAKEAINTVWSGAIRAAMTRLDPDQVAASGALAALDEALHEEAPTPGR